MDIKTQKHYSVSMYRSVENRLHYVIEQGADMIHLSEQFHSRRDMAEDLARELESLMETL